MVQPTGDLPWTLTSVRKSPNQYLVENGKLVVQRKNASELLSMGDNAPSIEAIVNQLNTLNQQRGERVLTPYELGLFSYTTRMLGVLLPLIKLSRWNRIEQTLRDYKSRSFHGFTHDEEGRAAWRAFLSQGE